MLEQKNGYSNDVDVLTNDYIRGLINTSAHTLVRRISHSSVGHRIDHEKDKFLERFTKFLDGSFIRSIDQSEEGKIFAQFIRIGCVIAGTSLVVAGNERFHEAQIRDAVLRSAKDIFVYGAKRSEQLGQKVDGEWLDNFIFNDVMQSVENWKNGGKEDFLLRAEKFGNTVLV